MNHQEKSDIQRIDEPLFVLKYVRYKLFLRLLVDTVVIQLLGIAASVAVEKNGYDFRGLFFFVLFVSYTLWFVSHVVHMLLFKEIRLYNDRIVRVSKWMGERQIRLAKAVVMAWRLLYAPRRFLDRDKGRRAWFEQVFYDENLADPKAVKQLNRLLAELSGRRVEDFERIGHSGMILMQEGRR